MWSQECKQGSLEVVYLQLDYEHSCLEPDFHLQHNAHCACLQLSYKRTHQWSMMRAGSAVIKIMAWMCCLQISVLIFEHIKSVTVNKRKKTDCWESEFVIIWMYGSEFVTVCFIFVIINHEFVFIRNTTMANRSVKVHRSFGQFLHTILKKEITCMNTRKI